MKRILLLYLVIFFYGSLNAQDSLRYQLRIDFGYSNSHADHYDVPSVYGLRSQGADHTALQSNLNFGFQTKSGFVWGLGTMINRDTYYFDGISESSPGVNVDLMSLDEIHTKIAPYIFSRCIKNIMPKFKFHTDIHAGYIYEKLSYQFYDEPQYHSAYEYEDEQFDAKQYLFVALIPSFSVALSQHIGFYLALGRIEYHHKISDSRTEVLINPSKSFYLSLKPQFWNIGININF